MSLRELRKQEIMVRQAWQEALAEVDRLEVARLRPGDGRGDGGQGEIAWREGFAVAQATEQRCWRIYEHARQRRIDAEVHWVAVLSAAFGVVVGLCTILQTIRAFCPGPN